MRISHNDTAEVEEARPFQEEAVFHNICSRTFTEEILYRFAPQGRTLSLPRGGALFYNEDPAEYIYYVRSGWIKLFRETLDGIEVVLDTISPGQIFGQDALFSEKRHTTNAEAAVITELTAFPLELLEQGITQDQALSQALLSHMARDNARRERELEHRAVQNAQQRIGCFLLRLHLDVWKGARTFPLPYDKTLIAMRLGMKPETFSRALTNLQRETGLHVRGMRIEIPDPEALADYACATCTGTFPCKDLKGR